MGQCMPSDCYSVLCTKFGVDSSSRFPDKQTDRRDWTPYPRRRLCSRRDKHTWSVCGDWGTWMNKCLTLQHTKHTWSVCGDWGTWMNKCLTLQHTTHTWSVCGDWGTWMNKCLTLQHTKHTWSVCGDWATWMRCDVWWGSLPGWRAMGLRWQSHEVSDWEDSSLCSWSANWNREPARVASCVDWHCR